MIGTFAIVDSFIIINNIVDKFIILQSDINIKEDSGGKFMSLSFLYKMRILLFFSLYFSLSINE